MKFDPILTESIKLFTPKENENLQEDNVWTVANHEGLFHIAKSTFINQVLPATYDQRENSRFYMEHSRG